MGQFRNVHGGADSHLSVEVSAWRYEDGQPGSHIIACNATPNEADGFGVYIRNPLAFHVEDFARDLGAGAAFAYAADLAAHLGCAVVSQLSRQESPSLPKGLAPGSPLYRNRYECPCGNAWSDEWDSGCDDECAACGATISPTESECLSEGALSAE